MKESSRRWIEAAKLVMANPDAKIKCPECGTGQLTVTDVEQNMVLDRYLVCDNCAAKNVITLLK